MKIQDSGLHGLAGANNSKQVSPAGSHARAGIGSTDDGGTDIVKLSSASQLITTAKALGASSQQARIDSIAAQVRSGTYQADLGQVSRAIVQGHLTN